MARYSRAQQKKGGWLLPAFLVVVILAALAVGFLALGQYLDPFGGRIAENVSVCGVSLGGTSIIIVVGVALETVRALESQMLMRHYKGFLD